MRTLEQHKDLDLSSIHIMGIRIRMIRECLGMSRSRFADLLGMPIGTLKNYELGYRCCDLHTVQLMLWNDKTKHLAKAMFMDTPIINTSSDRPPQYVFYNSIDKDVMDHRTVCLKLLNVLINTADNSGVHIPDFFIDRWTPKK